MVWTSAVMSSKLPFLQFRKCKITSIRMYLYLTSLCYHYSCLGYRIPVSNCSVTVEDWLDGVVSYVVCSCFV